MAIKRKPSPYIPSFLRAAIEGNRPVELTFNDVKETNIASTSSFLYDAQDSPLKSTQQLNVDWSKFENHTFFMSAEAKVNLAFEQVINGYPFDGTKAETEAFFEKLTGFDRWVFDSFPRFHGQLMFTGTVPGETSPTSGTYIVVKDAPGAMYPELSRANAKTSVLNPKGTSLSIETHVFLPESVTPGVQVLCQKMSGSTHGFALYLTSSASTSEAEIRFSVISGAANLTVPCTLQKGRFNQICAILNREAGDHYLEFYKNGESTNVTKSKFTIGDMDIDASDFLIGSGSAFYLGTQYVEPTCTFSGTLDEFRVFHSARSGELQRAYLPKSIYAQPTLKAYFRFNEPPPPLSTTTTDSVNSIVIDSSGNSLHSTITNFLSYADYDSNGNLTGSSLRQDASEDDKSLLIYEREDSVAVLFPGHEDVIDLNSTLLYSASIYDDANPNLTTKLVPQHYLLAGAAAAGFEEPEGYGGDPYGGEGIPGEGQIGNVQIMLSMLYIYARFFDEMKLFIDSFATLRTVSYDDEQSMPHNFLRDLVRYYGFHLPPLFNDTTIEQYIEGENVGQEISTNSRPIKHVQNQLLKRVLINLPDVLKSKGTQHSIKVFLRSIGIDPDNTVRLREFGGPTYRQLSHARESKRDVAAMVEFQTSSFVATPFLSASRYEPGFPYTTGSFVLQDVFAPTGISNNQNDGLLTSGSWTVETIVKYVPVNVGAMTSATQSLVRMCVTGSNAGSPGLIANLIAVSSSIDPKMVLYLRPGMNESSPLLQMSMSLPDGALFNGDKWNVSFGCVRNDDPMLTERSHVSSSYFVRIGHQNFGDITYYSSTSSYFYELITSESNSLRTLHSTYNHSGAYLSIGENILIPEGSSNNYLYLNNYSVGTSGAEIPDEARVTAFTGMQSNLRFWSKALTDEEWREHIRNYRSNGVADPLVNYNYVKTRSGSFGHLRLDTLRKQETKRANATASLGPLGTITFIDFSENGFHLTGSGFPEERDCVRSELFDGSYLSPYFDEAATNEKVRIRSFINEEYLVEAPWASKAPVYELVRSELPDDDVRFAIEFSLIDALNRDIITMFSTLDAMNNYIGSPELLHSPDYPDLERLRDVYFNRIKDKLNFKAFFEFFRWFDTSIGTFIKQLVPRKTNFKGTNFVIESHMLERHKLSMQPSEQYVNVSSRTRPRDVLLLSQISGEIKKY